MAETSKNLVLVGVDGSTPSGRAVDWAVREAALRQAALHIEYLMDHSRVDDFLTAQGTHGEASRLREYGAAVLEAATDRAIRFAPGVSLRTHLGVGSPHETITELGAIADLLVTGSNAVSVDDSAPFGSIGSRQTTLFSTPVAIIPMETPRIRPDARTEGRITVGVDGSSHADAALRFALDEATLRCVPLLVVSAWHDPVTPTWAAATRVAPERTEEGRKAAVLATEEALRRTRTDRHRNLEIEVVCPEGQPGPTLRAIAGDASMTVIGTRGRGNSRGRLLGSVTQDVLRHSKRPVVIVHST